MPRPFDPESLNPYASTDLRASMGIGAMVWRYTVLVPFEEVRPGEMPKVLATEEDMEAISEALCNHFGGLSVEQGIVLLERQDVFLVG